MNTVRLIVAFVIVLVVVVAVSANLDQTSGVVFRFLGMKRNTTVGVLVILSWGAGVVSYFVFSVMGEIRLRTRLARQRREIEALTHELSDLRNLPLAGDEEASEIRRGAEREERS